jgi:hyperosmotically inducible protein
MKHSNAEKRLKYRSGLRLKEGLTMKLLHFFLRSAVLLCLLSVLGMAVQSNAPAPSQKNSYSPRAQERITRAVRHELLMLPNYGEAFDHIAFKLQGYDVILLGQVVQATLKSDAEHAVKHIEGVEQVVNNIEILPPSGGDDRLRLRLFRAIYGYGPLQHYGVGSNRPIHIIVNRGHVTLEGVVLSQGDKNLAGMRANGVPGAFSVTNNLMVEHPQSNHKTQGG